MVSLQLQQMVENVRFETGNTSNAAQGLNQLERIKYLLRRTQEELYNQYDWPQLMTYRDIPTLQGMSLYDFPDDLNFESIVSVSHPIGSEWVPLSYGIGDAEYSVYDETTQVDPPRNWGFDADQKQLELWPTPASASKIRVWGVKALSPLIGNSDFSTLDGNMLVLFVASEMLAKNKDESAASKLQKANDYFRKLRSRNSKKGTIVLGANDPGARKMSRPYLDYIPRGG